MKRGGRRKIGYRKKRNEVEKKKKEGRKEEK